MSQSAKLYWIWEKNTVKQLYNFPEMMDKLFDCLNVNNFTAERTKRKIFIDEVMILQLKNV